MKWTAPRNAHGKATANIYLEKVHGPALRLVTPVERRLLGLQVDEVVVAPCSPFHATLLLGIATYIRSNESFSNEWTIGYWGGVRAALAWLFMPVV